MSDATEVTEKTDEEESTALAPSEESEETENPAAMNAAMPDTETAESEGAESTAAVADASGGEAKPPVSETSNDEGLPNDPLAALASKRVIYQVVGTVLILGGLLTIGLTVGVSAFHKQRQDSDTQAFLQRVSTPRAFPATTPFPSTVAGGLVPNNALTPTANSATRAAQPVATTTDGKNRSLLAAQPAIPTATPAATPVATSTEVAAPTEEATPTPKPRMPLPTHLSIPSLGIDSNIIEVGVSPVEIDGQEMLTWDVAPYAVGHNFSSANPGEGENIVLAGHDDWQGEVFKNLYKVKQGAEIDVQAGDRVAKYRVDDILLLPEVGEPLEKRMENAKFIGTTGDERVTLITCWPYGVDDHRLVVIAHPMQQ